MKPKPGTIHLANKSKVKEKLNAKFLGKRSFFKNQP